MHLVGFNYNNLSRCTVTWTSIYHDARSPESQFITMHGHLNINLSRCKVTWKSICHDARSPERQFITMHGHLNVNLSRCTVTWKSICHDAQSPERQFITMQGHLNVNLSRCTVTWKSIYHDARSPERQFITMHGQLKVKHRKRVKTYIFLFWSGVNRECYGKLVVYASEGFPSIEIRNEEDTYLVRKYLFTGINITFLFRTERIVRRKLCIRTYNILIPFPARKRRWLCKAAYARLP